MTTATFADRAEAFIHKAMDRGLTVYVSRPAAAAKIRALPKSERAKVIRRSTDGELLFGMGARTWKLCPADDIRAR
jgi:hypothetical protein